METFTAPRAFLEDHRYTKDREDTLKALDLDSIDEPIVDIVTTFSKIPYCFTLQCCYGHFVCVPEQDPHNLDPISNSCTGLVQYRIAYLAFCLENSRRGRDLWRSLARVPMIDLEYVQFGSADWFWDLRVNSYVLQVEPYAQQLKDEVISGHTEALHLQGVRDLFFKEIRALLVEELRVPG